MDAICFEVSRCDACILSSKSRFFIFPVLCIRTTALDFPCGLIYALRIPVFESNFYAQPFHVISFRILVFNCEIRNSIAITTAEAELSADCCVKRSVVSAVRNGLRFSGCTCNKLQMTLLTNS